MSALTDLQDEAAGTQADLATLTANFDAFVKENSGGATDAQLTPITATLQQVRLGIGELNALVKPPDTAPTPGS